MSAGDDFQPLNFRLAEAEPDAREFAMRRLASAQGVPQALMRAPLSGARRPVAPVVGSWRQGFPPVLPGGLCAGSRGLAGLSRFDDALLVWYRSHGAYNGDQVARLLWLRLVADGRDGCDCLLTPVQAFAVIRAAMDVAVRGVGEEGGRIKHVRSGTSWRAPLNARDAKMRAQTFQAARNMLVWWLMMKVLAATRAYAHATSGRESQVTANCHNRKEGGHSVHYPTRGNVRLYKARPVADPSKAA